MLDCPFAAANPNSGTYGICGVCSPLADGRRMPSWGIQLPQARIELSPVLAPVGLSGE